MKPALSAAAKDHETVAKGDLQIFIEKSSTTNAEDNRRDLTSCETIYAAARAA